MIVAPADILRAYFVTLGSVTFPVNNFSWPGFVGFLPDDGPDDAVCFYGSEIPIDGTISRTGEIVEHWEVQIRVRTPDYPSGWQKLNSMDTVMKAINKVSVPVDGHNYVLQKSYRRTSPVHIGQEKKNRREAFTANYILSIKEIN